MRKRVSDATFGAIIDGRIYLDKAKNTPLITVGYRWFIKEFDFSLWQYTGRYLQAEISEVFEITSSVSLSNSTVAHLNRKYKFFSFVVTGVFG